MSKVVGLLWAWWLGDLFGPVTSLEGLRISSTENTRELTQVFGYGIDELEKRFSSDHRAYAVSIDEKWVACGWSASGHTSFGVPEVCFTVPDGNSYLLDFITLPAWRGKGIYPWSLQAIISQELANTNRFWVIHEASNHASFRGIEKAGFSLVSEVCAVAGGLSLLAVSARTEAGADVLGLPIISRT